MQINNEALSFDDVLIVPSLSETKSRKNVDIKPRPLGGTKSKIPFLCSPMDTIVGKDFAKAFMKNGGVPFLHRFCEIDEQICLMSELGMGNDFIPSIPLNGGLEWVNELEKSGFSGRLFNLDTANAYRVEVRKFLRDFKANFPYNCLIVGNICTGDALAYLMEECEGSDCIEGVRVGIGNGSICSTRLMTGVGVPQLKAVKDVAFTNKLNGYNTTIISDGGIKKPADAVKAFAAGAHYVMSGRIFAGIDEAKCQGTYRGMASKEAQRTVSKDFTPEGVSFDVPIERSKLSVKEVLNMYCGGLRSAISYVSHKNLYDFINLNVDMVRVTESSKIETDTTGF